MNFDILQYKSMKNQTNNLSDEYPDLSDIDEPKSQPNIPSDEPIPRSQPSKKVKKDQQLNPNSKKIVGPAFLGGRSFVPPPPPKQNTNIKTTSPPQPPKENTFSVPDFSHGPQRQRKNCIFIENIAKMMNHTEKLTTFFKNYGSIKNIKVNEDKNSAIVRFHREQDALKFMNSKTKVFNRSYILYSLNEDIEVTDDMKKQREKDQISLAKPDRQLYILKDNEQLQLADRYRSLLYLAKHLHQGQFLDQVNIQMEKCRRIKEAKKTDEELLVFLDSMNNPYDWTLIFSRKTKETLEKKKIIQQFLKYGFIGTLDLRMQQTNESQPKKEEESSQKLVTIKIKFLGIKSSWQMFKELSEELKLRVEGEKLQTIFNLWQSKMPRKEPTKQAKENQQQP